MKQIIYQDYEELSIRTAEMIAQIIESKPDALLCFAAGETSVGTFRYLAGMNRAGKLSFKKSRIVGLDEWAHLGKMKNENCLSFLRKNLFDHIGYSEKNFCFFNGEADDLDSEGVKTDEFIRRFGPVDMMLLGAGMNGHLGLNEPGISFDLYSHIVDLDETTKKVGQKYFSEKVDLRSGISLGIRHVIEAKTVILQVNGSRKAEVVKKLLDSEISNAFPASVVKSHLCSYLLLDKEAAALL
ncbi:MAG TPA: glucosamine-6-phosphate deaminase [Bacteroidales bacterium]|nr:glucosamine-6-phosphate deaminase [Bacteroidales bacterium]